ncbi:dihydroorotase [Desulfosediminicola sp.]|uniref:dihydroorotase n=1 Tax=Desulfosediminicola sp. TaxID=2886825 RepID=UPI003AF3095F
MSIILDSPLDMHLHLREGEMLQCVAPLTARDFAGAVVMPNLISPVDSEHKLSQYRRDIERVCGQELFTPYMTLFFKPYSLAELENVKDQVIGLKLYPAGITTQSEAGVTDFSEIEETLQYMQDLSIPLLVHGETSGFVMDREREFIEVYRDLAVNFPKLHIIMEHITTADSVEFMEKYDNVSATVTLHHLMITLDDVVGGFMQPDLFCKPIAKTPRDRGALRSAVFSGNPRIMFGSDSAPHPRHRKECVGCAAGVFTAPVALPLLAQIFAEEGCLDLLQSFVSDNACKRYRISPPEKRITLTEKEWVVPELYGTVRPFYGGERLFWAVKRDGE